MGSKSFIKTVKMAALATFVAGSASATEPLQDQIWYQSRAGTVHQSGKGAIALPPSDRLRAMAMAESCSAMGGPRGVYKYMGGKLWLAGLRRCSGGVGLGEAYPDMLTPPVAHWVSGVLIARFGKKLCTSPEGKPVHEIEVRFTVDGGNVISLQEKVGERRFCPRL